MTQIAMCEAYGQDAADIWNHGSLGLGKVKQGLEREATCSTDQIAH